MDIRPTKAQKRLGVENGWEGEELKFGYGVFQDDEDDFEYLARIDDMEVFDCDGDAVEQARKDGKKFLTLTLDQAEKISYYPHISPSITTSNILDTPHNRQLLEKILRD